MTAPAAVPLRLTAKSLGAAATPGAHVRFSYRSPVTDALIEVDGLLEHYQVGVDGSVLLRVDRLTHMPPPDTLVTIETREIR